MIEMNQIMQEIKGADDRLSLGTYELIRLKNEINLEIEKRNKERENSYGVIALSRLWDNARQYLYDTFDAGDDLSIRQMDIDRCVWNLERNFLKWLKNGEDLKKWDSAIFLVDIVISAGILHEKLSEIELKGDKYE